MSGVSHNVDRLGVVFDEASLVADAGLSVAGALMGRLGVGEAVDASVRLGGRPGGASPGRKVLSLAAAMLVGATHIDHVDRLRAGATRRVLGFAVMAPSTLGTFLRAFTWGHVRQLDRATGEVLARAWAAGGGPGDAPMTIDVDSTICEVSGKNKDGAAYESPWVLWRLLSLEARVGPWQDGGRQVGGLLVVAAGWGRPWRCGWCGR
ncbi:MAG: hypothetical protein OXG52_12790 [bacterium]|nr:hypothetical protein [bacterium]